MKAFKNILALFLAISMMMNGVGFCADSSGILEFLQPFCQQGPAIQSISQSAADPFEIIKVYGTGFSNLSDMLVTFAKESYVIEVAPIYGTTNSLEVPVPVFFDTVTGEIGSAIVSTHNKKIDKEILKFIFRLHYSLSSISTEQPGKTFVACLQDLQTIMGYAKSHLSFVESADQRAGEYFDDDSSINQGTNKLAQLQTAITAIMDNSPAGSPEIQALAVADRFALGLLAH